MITGKKYLSQTSIIGGQRILSKILSLIYWILIASIFSLLEIGIIAILAIIVNVSVPISLLRVYTYAEYKISHSIGEQKWATIHGTIRKTIGVTLLLALTLGLGLFFLAKPVTGILNISAEFILLIQMTGIAIIVSPFFKLGRSFLSGLIRGNAIAVMEFVQPLTLCISGFVLFPYFRLIGLPIAWIISSLTSFLISVYFIRDVFHHPSRSPSLKDIFAFSLPLCFAGIVKFASNRVDQLLVLGFLGVAPLGLYYLVLEGIGILLYLSRTLLTLFFPTMGEAIEYGRNRAQLVLSRVLKFVFALVFPFLVLSSIVGFPFFSLIFFGKLAGGEILFIILCLVYAFNNFREILEFVLLAAGYKNLPLQISGISFVIRAVSLPILFILIPIIDIIGIVYIIELCATTIFVFTYFRKKLGFLIPFFSMLKIILATGVAIIVLFIFSAIFGGILYLLIAVGCSVIVYLAFLSILKTYDIDEIRFLKRSTPKPLHPLINLLQRPGLGDHK